MLKKRLKAGDEYEMGIMSALRKQDTRPYPERHRVKVFSSVLSQMQNRDTD